MAGDRLERIAPPDLAGFGVDPDEGAGGRCRARARAIAGRDERGDHCGTHGEHEHGEQRSEARPRRARHGRDTESHTSVLDERGTRLVPVVRILCHRTGEHGVDGGRQLRSSLARRGGLLLEVREERRDVRGAIERTLSRERLVEQAAERVDVGAPVDRVAADLLGSDVVDRPHQLAVVTGRLRTLCVRPKSAR